MAKRRAATTAPPQPDLWYISESLRPLAVPIGDLKPDPANARTHGPKNLEAIRGSLAVYGQVKPVVVRKDNGVVVAGNGTLQAALAMGWTHLAVVYVTMDAATAAGFAIADNRTAELAEWDRDALDRLLREVSTGNDERLDAMLADLAVEASVIPGAEDSQEVKEIAVKPPPTIVWLLIGIPLDAFGPVQHHVAALQEVSAIHVQSNRDGEDQGESQEQEPLGSVQPGGTGPGSTPQGTEGGPVGEA